MTLLSMKIFDLTFKVSEEEGERLTINNCLMSQRREEGTDAVNTLIWRRSKLDIHAFRQSQRLELE